MSDQFPIGGPRIPRPALRPESPAARPASTRPLAPDGAAGALPSESLKLSRNGRTSELALGSLPSAPSAPAAVLPSLDRIRAALATPAPSAMAGRPKLSAIADDTTFVQTAYEQALGRKPTRDEQRAALESLYASGDRSALLAQIAGSDEFVRRAVRVDQAYQTGTPVTMGSGDQAQTVLWPYPPGSRHGGPEQLASEGDQTQFRTYMAPFANYFGAGTRGSSMQAVSEQASKGGVYPGSAATQELGTLAQTLFWDLPMQQNTDAAMRAAGVGPNLSDPPTMAAYLAGQQARIEQHMGQMDPSQDGALHQQAARELLGMVKAARGRAEAFVAGDRAPLESAPTGTFGVYNAARHPADQPPVAFGPEVAADPAGAAARADAAAIATASRLGDASFYQQLSSYLLKA